MSFRFKLSLTVLISVLILSTIHLIGLQWVIGHYENALADDRRQAVDMATQHIAAALENLDVAAINLSKPREVVNAVEEADNEALHDWGSAFTGRLDRITFTDAQGLVIARAPDEFRFGDDISDCPSFRAAMTFGHFLGVLSIRDRTVLAAARVLRKYDDMPVGTVRVGLVLTPALLRSLAMGSNVVLTYTDKSRTIAAAPTEASLPRLPLRLTDVDMDIPGRFDLVFLRDEGHERLLGLKRSLYVSAALAAAATIAAVLFLLHGQIAPYGAMIGGILEYSNNATSLSSLRQRLQDIFRRTDPKGELGQVVTALTRMIDTLDSNFKRIEADAERLEIMARNDSLTGLYNRRFMDETLDGEIARSTRYGTPFSVILVDLDHFKAVNDSHGHAVGDIVLHHTATLLRQHGRVTDRVGRWGGEEFLILCPQTPLDQAQNHAENLRVAIQDTAAPHGIPLTASFGVAEYLMGESASSLVARADVAMYAAKAAGRNAVCPG